jgi:hypothetical protein
MFKMTTENKRKRRDREEMKERKKIERETGRDR